MRPRSSQVLQRHLEVEWELLKLAHDDLDNTPGAETAAKEEVSLFQSLPTTKVSLQGPTGHLQTCRAVIDSGSQVNLISRRMADLLSLKEMSSPIKVSGIGGKITTPIRSILKLSSTSVSAASKTGCALLRLRKNLHF